ncbi:hypothetical protein ASF71_21030 [Deinococcus sp. Leaf326]|nr:hypothetical protein ASF71_21030 [Deinococcus sp. Leaf326]
MTPSLLRVRHLPLLTFLVGALSSCAPTLWTSHDITGRIFNAPAPADIEIELVETGTGNKISPNGSETAHVDGFPMLYGLDFPGYLRQGGGTFQVIAYLDRNQNHVRDPGEASARSQRMSIEIGAPGRQPTATAVRAGLNGVVNGKAVSWGQVQGYDLRF